ncbi:MAG: hypothetical protein AAF362_10820 [Pseudomonadota bacterium]
MKFLVDTADIGEIKDIGIIPPAVIRKFRQHPLTDNGLEQFL